MNKKNLSLTGVKDAEQTRRLEEQLSKHKVASGQASETWTKCFAASGKGGKPRPGNID
jgi:hypothetical protein